MHSPIRIVSRFYHTISLSRVRAHFYLVLPALFGLREWPWPHCGSFAWRHWGRRCYASAQQWSWRVWLWTRWPKRWGPVYSYVYKRLFWTCLIYFCSAFLFVIFFCRPRREGGIRNAGLQQKYRYDPYFGLGDGIWAEWVLERSSSLRNLWRLIIRKLFLKIFSYKRHY